jgi:hypothetical protein
MSQKIKDIISDAVIKSYETKENIFDIVLSKIQEFFDLPAHNISEIKKKESKKIKGDYWEELCKLYLLKSPKFTYKNVWLLHEVPTEVLKSLGLRKMDYGIDIICETLGGKFVAVQCKYRKIGRSAKNVITWNMLSTFYALCLKTGPYEKYIVMTNADYITHMGPKTSKDLSICIGTWRNLPVETWIVLSGSESHKVSEEPAELPMTVEKLRELRLAKFG